MRKALGTTVELNEYEWQQVTKIWVPGLPVTQGSMRRARNGKMFHTNSHELTRWRNRIRDEYAKRARTDGYDGPVGIQLAFRLPRPRFAENRAYPHRRHAHNGDIDKLTRAVLDALTGTNIKLGVFKDDVRVCALAVEKTYADKHREPGDRTGCEITVYRPARQGQG